MTGITVSRAKPEEMDIIRHFFVAYFYDLSAYDDQIVINTYGLPVWQPFGLPGPHTVDECARYNWWDRDDHLAYLIRVEGGPAGFFFICADARHLATGIDYELTDFYIAPKYRRQGIGRQAARQAFDLYRGTWQVFQLKRNEPALRFWHTLIAEYTGGHFDDLDNGTQQRFNNSLIK